MTVLALHWIGWIELFLSIATSAYLLALFVKYRKLSFNSEKSYLYTMIFVPTCAVLSIVFHPGFFEEGFDFPSMMIALGNYLEAGALVPQLMLIRKEGYIKKQLLTFILLLVMSRVCRIVFWILLIWIEGGYFFTIILSDIIYIAQVSD